MGLRLGSLRGQTGGRPLNVKASQVNLEEDRNGSHLEHCSGTKHRRHCEQQMTSLPLFPVTSEHAGGTLAAILRAHLPGQSWSQIKALVAARRVKVLGELCLDPARRLKEGDTVELLAHSAPKPRTAESIVLRHLDEDVVVVEKPSGV